MEALDFDTVYSRHADYVHRLLRHFGVCSAELDDAVQDAFVRIHRLLGEFEGRAKIETWIHAICWRVAAEYRRRGRRRFASDASEPNVQAAPELPRGEQLRASLGVLDACDRDLLVLREVGELSISALSELTGSSRATIRKRLERARLAVGRSIGLATKAVDDVQPAGVDAALCTVDEAALARLAQHADEREYLCADYGFSRCGHLVIARWRGVNDIQALAICAKVTLAAAAQATDGFTYCSVIEPSSAPPDRDAREISAWLMAKAASRVRGIAFATSPELRPLVPQIVNSYTFMSGSQLIVRIFDDTTLALTWLTQQTPGASLPTVLEHCENMRLRMDALGAPQPQAAQEQR